MYIVVQILLTALIFMFLIYVIVEVRALRNKKHNNNIVQNSSEKNIHRHVTFPSVSVLLPIYNEKLVVDRLINAVCALDYPPGQMEVLVLDDSTDETSSIALSLIKRYAAKGINAHYLRREKRIGYKAGNLNFGLKHAKGEFIAIFDADCLPPVDFLKKVMPCFENPKVGFLQTKIVYANAGNTFLTRFQATEAAHKEDVTSGFAKDGFMASLTGSSCVWRKACIDDIGGISQETITEDVDMGYAAQLKNWAYVFPDYVASLAELPEAMASFRVQRQRWARGLAHNALLHARELFHKKMSPLARLHAITLIFSPFLLALFYFMLLLSPFVALATPYLGWFFNISCLTFLCATGIWAWANTSGKETGAEKISPWLELKQTMGYVLLFFPLALYYFSALIQTLFNGRGEFHSTPKGCGRKKVSHPRINTILLALEIFSCIYALTTIILSLMEKNYWVTLYDSLALGGFLMTLAFSLSDSRKKFVPIGHILITGASGSIGSALAKEYAVPGMLLTLQGRNKEKLDELAKECAKKGASVDLVILDLENTEAVHEWAEKISKENTPDLVICNAGQNINIGPQGQGESYHESLACAKVNLLSMMALVDGLLPEMRKRKYGQIAIMSSLGAYFGLAATPTYCATKGALKNWGTSLRGWLASEGIHINVIFPGYVKSPMCDAMPGPKPFLWCPERAAKKIRKGLERDQARISFPFPLNVGIWGLSVLPLCVALPIARILGYGR